MSSEKQKKYVVWCNQRHQYYGAYHDIDEEDHKALYKMGAIEIAELFDWEVKDYEQEKKNLLWVARSKSNN